jgi:hypothetical protein
MMIVTETTTALAAGLTATGGVIVKMPAKVREMIVEGMTGAAVSMTGV